MATGRSIRSWAIWRSQRWRDVAAIALLALATFVFFWKILFTHDYTNLASWDQAVQWYPWYRFAADWVRQGVLPLWDPYAYGGHTFIGEAQAGLFYPLNLLQAFLIPAGRSLAPSDMYWMAALHGFLAAVFMYALARVLGMRRAAALVAAIVWAFSASMARRVQIHTSIFYGFAWLPLIFALFHLSATRRKPLLAVAAGIVLGAVTLLGSLSPAVYCGLLLAAYAIYLTYRAWRRQDERAAYLYPAAMLVIVAAFAAGAAAIQLLPSLEYQRLVVRWTGSPVDPFQATQRFPYWVAGGMFYFHPDSLISFLMPHVNEPPERSVYLGILGLILAGVGVVAQPARTGNRFFAVLALVAFLFALGGNSIVHGLIWLSVPFMDENRVPVRSLLLFSFCCALLAGWGMQSLLDAGPQVRRLMRGFPRRLGLCIAGFAILGVALGIIAPRVAPGIDLKPYALFLLMAVLAWIVIALWRPGRRAQGLWLALAAGVLLFDALFYGAGNFQRIEDYDKSTNWAPEAYYQESGALRFLRQQPGYFRIENSNNALPPNFGDIWSLPGLMGFAATIQADYWNMRGAGWLSPSPVFDMLNARYVVTTDTIKAMPLVYAGSPATGDPNIYENPSALPRAWLVHTAAQATPGDETWAKLREPDFDPRAVAIVEAPLDLPAGTGGSAEITDYGLHEIALDVAAPTDSLLVLSENYYPGWVVRVDGKKSDLLRVNGGLRGVKVGAGEHSVVFSYEPRSVRLGAAITLATVAVAIALAALALVLRRRRTS